MMLILATGYAPRWGERVKVLLIKAQVKGYTRKDGTYVAPHARRTGVGAAQSSHQPKAAREKPAMIKAMVLFLKARVGPYMRGGKMVNLRGYEGRRARAGSAGLGQMSLFGDEAAREKETLVDVKRSLPRDAVDPDRKILLIKPGQYKQSKHEPSDLINNSPDERKQENVMKIPEDAKLVRKDFVIKKVGRKWIEVTAPGKTFVMQLAIGPETGHLKAGDTVKQLPVAEHRKSSKYGVQVQYFPMSADAVASVEKQQNQAEIERWLDFVENAARKGYIYNKGMDRLRALGAQDDPASQDRIDAAKRKVADAKAAKQEQWDKERAERQKERMNNRAEVNKRRILFPLSAFPDLNRPVMMHGRPVVFTGSGAKFRINGDHSSLFGHHLLGYEGDMGAYVYFRDATDDEVAKMEEENSNQPPRERHWAYSQDAVDRALRMAD